MLYNFYVIQKLKRFGLFGFVVLLVAVHIFLPTLHASADATSSPDDSYKKEYVRWKAALIVVDCLDNDFDASDDEIGQYGGQDGYIWGTGDVSASTVLGKNSDIKVDYGTNEIDCRTQQGSLAKAIGFGSVTKLEEYWFPKTDKNGNERGDGDHTPLANGIQDLIGKYESGRSSHDAVKRAIFEYTLQKFGDRVELSKGAQFWYWKNALYYNCYGELTDDYSRFTGVSNTSFREPNQVKDKDAAGGQYQGAKDGEAHTFKYAVFDKNPPNEFDDTDNLEGIDRAIISDRYTSGNSSSTDVPDCVDLVGRFKGNYMKDNIADYLTKYQQLLKECTDSGKTDADCKSQVTTPSIPPSNTNPATDEEIGFQCTLSFNPISWFMCPLISGFAVAVNQLDGQINDMLTIDTDTYFSSTNPSDPASGFKQVWKNMRVLSISFLVIIGLIMVIGTAIGTGFFDAYTVKKIFPRLVAAVVLIAVSWPLVIFMIDASNAIGLGIRTLIQSPFATALGNNVTVDAGQLTLGSIGVVGLGLSLGVVGLLSFAATALLAVFVAFLTLIFRQLLIILLAVVAPIAIAAYILPNTQKAGKLWWDFFTKALLAFPIISAFIAIGRVFAVVSQQGPGGNSGTVRGFIAFIAYFGPYFALPQAFRMAGGALANLSGMVNDRGRGVFDRLKNVRQQQRKQRWEDARNENLLRGGTEENRRGTLNRGIALATNINKAGLRPRRMRANMRTALRQNEEKELEHILQDKEFTSWSGDDAKNFAARFTDENQIAAALAEFDAGRFAGDENRQVREDAVAMIMRSQRKYSPGAFQRARVEAQSKTGTAYQYTDENGQVQVDIGRALQDINEAYGADRSGAGAALARIRNNWVQSGHTAGLAGYGVTAQAMEDLYNHSVSEEEAHNRVIDDAARSVSPDQAFYGKPAAAAAIGASHRRQIEAIAEGIRTGGEVRVGFDDRGREIRRHVTQDDLSQAVASAMGLFDSISRANPNNANAMANELFDGTLDLSGTGIPLPAGGLVGPDGAPLAGGNVTVRELDQVLQTTGDQTYLNRRGTYAAQAATAAQEALRRGMGGGPGGPPPTPTGGPPPTPLG